MSAKPTLGADLLGATRLALEAVAGVTELVEAVHMTVLNQGIGTPLVRPVAGVTSLVYRSVKGVTRMVGGGLDMVLERLVPVLGEPDWKGRDTLLAAVNGVLGDRLEQTGNPLAIPMQLHQSGPQGSRIVVLAHGLCMNHLQWEKDGISLGNELPGYTPVYLHYNTGRHISVNGREFAAQLQALVDGWPVPVSEIVIVGHSMGGLVARSACHYAAQAGQGWLGLLSKMVFLGSPHHGAPLERGGNWVHVVTDLTPYSAPFSRLAKIRSAGITDLRHASLVDADWAGKDRFAHGTALPEFVPLPKGVLCYAVAGTIASALGDGLVPLTSALGQHSDPARCLRMSDSLTLEGVNHMHMLHAPAVHQQVRAWL